MILEFPPNHSTLKQAIQAYRGLREMPSSADESPRMASILASMTSYKQASTLRIPKLNRSCCHHTVE